MAVGRVQSTWGRKWADVLGMLTGLTLLALAVWPGDPTAAEEASRELGSAQLVWVLHGLGGLATIGGLVLAQSWRWRTLGRALVGGAGIALVAALLVTRDFATRSLLLLLVPGLLLIACAFVIGPMPAPEED